MLFESAQIYPRNTSSSVCIFELLSRDWSYIEIILIEKIRSTLTEYRLITSPEKWSWTGIETRGNIISLWRERSSHLSAVIYFRKKICFLRRRYYSRRILRCSNFAEKGRSKRTGRTNKRKRGKSKWGKRIPRAISRRYELRELKPIKPRSYNMRRSYNIGHRVRVSIGLATALSWSHGRGPFNSTRTRRTVSRKVWFSMPWTEVCRRGINKCRVRSTSGK